MRLLEALESLNPTPAPAKATDLLEGDWRLVYASEDVTRSSPFFWAWRRLLKGIRDPNPFTRRLFGTEALSESIFAVTDGLPAKTIGVASQSIQAGQLVNRVEVRVFGLGSSIMTTTCRYDTFGQLWDEEQAYSYGEGRKDSGVDDATELRLTVETTQAVGGSRLIERVVFPSERLLGASANVVMRITYLDQDLRIVRNADDGRAFAYVRVPREALVEA